MTEEKWMLAQVAQNNVVMATANLLIGQFVNSSNTAHLVSRLLDTNREIIEQARKMQ
ncbi:MAG TPA: hypothetical protein VGF75_00410 [Candidatus Saccharimonadales bacterium]|jgi:hypothetical protein